MNDAKFVHIQVDSELVRAAQNKANLWGFSSVQEMMKVLLTHIAKGNIETQIILSGRRDESPSEYVKFDLKTKKRWEQIIRDADSDRKEGNYIITASVEDAMKYLFEES